MVKILDLIKQQSTQQQQQSGMGEHTGSQESSATKTTTSTTKQTTIAYAVTVTTFSLEGKYPILDYCAVLHQSVKFAHQHSKYDYEMIAYLHKDTDTTVAVPLLQKLGYKVFVKGSPVNENEVFFNNHDLYVSTKAFSCCGFNEWMKLYPYTMTEYPLVVVLDLDTIVLKPMDELFDHMILSSSNTNNNNNNNNMHEKEPFIHAMWKDTEAKYTNRVDFAFTRDYSMSNPMHTKRDKVGVQGGLFVVRPDPSVFDRMVRIITEGGDFVQHVGWGGKVLPKGEAFGHYYGEGTVQGFLPYYYYHLDNTNSSLELNRCLYNNVLDEPLSTKVVANMWNKTARKIMCSTGQPMEECESCKDANIDDIYVAHYTACGKPAACSLEPRQLSTRRFERLPQLCRTFNRRWHDVRTYLEIKWNQTVPQIGYHPEVTLGHCKELKKYIKMTFPSSMYNNSETVSIL